MFRFHQTIQRGKRAYISKRNSKREKQNNSANIPWNWGQVDINMGAKHVI